MKKEKYIRTVLDKLQPLTKIPSSKSVQLVPVLSDDCIHAICESCYNLLRNTYGLYKKKIRSVKRKLSQSKNDVRSLAKPNTSLLKKRKLLMHEQTGRGIFTILASTVIPALVAALIK